MTPLRKKFLSITFAFFCVFLILDFRDLVHNGFYASDGTSLYEIVHNFKLPGIMLGGLFVILIYQNMHNYNGHVLIALAIVLNAVIYGIIATWILRIIHTSMSSKSKGERPAA